MSGVVKTVKKVFKKVAKVVKKIIKPVLIGAAIYFTAGLALSAFAPTAAFAASMPGFAGGGILGTGIGAGATAGTGLFSQGAVALGVGGGLASGAAAAGTTAAELTGIYGAGTALAATGAAPATTAALGATFGGAATSAVAGLAPAATGIGKAAGSIAGMSFSDKLLMTKIATDTAGALFGPTPAEEAEDLAIENAKFRGSFYGTNADGSGGAAAPPAVPSPAIQSPGRDPVQVVPPQQAPDQNSITPEQQSLLDGRKKKELFPGGSQPQVGTTTGPGEMQSNIPIPEGLFSAAPNVRYV